MRGIYKLKKNTFLNKIDRNEKFIFLKNYDFTKYFSASCLHN